MMQWDLRTRLDGQTGADDRVTWLERPQGDGLPAITLQTVVDGQEQHLKGFHGLQESRVQLDVWALSYVEAQTIAQAAVEAVVPADTVGDTVFSRTLIENRRDLTDRAAEATIYRVSMDLIVHHKPA